MEDSLAVGRIVPDRGRLAVYSCYFGKYEPFHRHALGPEGDWDRIIFTDHADLEAVGCRIVHLPAGHQGMTAKQLSRLPKLWPERFLAAYDWVIYIDNRARLLVTPHDLVARLEAGHGGAAPAGRYLVRHRARDCAWREAEVCRRMAKLDDAEMARVHAWFAATGLPRNAGLYVNTALVQKMGSPETARLNEAWFRAFVTIAGRDQVLLPNVIRETGLPQQDIGMALADFVAWPAFGFKVRNRFQQGRPLPAGWDEPAGNTAPDEAVAELPEEAPPPQAREVRLNRKLRDLLTADEVSRLEAGAVRVGEEGMTLYRYDAADGFDAALYRKVQILTNRLTIRNQWVPEDHIAILARYVSGQGVRPAKGICHGTRRGLEQMWFRAHLGPQAEISGTEISETAMDFPHTIQWDFHEVDPAWLGAMDLVYSNSWDHAHDPERAFAGWIRCLKPGGFLMLDHGWNYLPDRVSPMDPFGISEAGLVKMLNRLGAGQGEVVDVINGGMHKRHQIRTVVFQGKD